MIGAFLDYLSYINRPYDFPVVRITPTPNANNDYYNPNLYTVSVSSQPAAPKPTAAANEEATKSLYKSMGIGRNIDALVSSALHSYAAFQLYQISQILQQ